MDYPFHAIIKPVGDRCNLNCNYCFYKEKSEAGSLMKKDILERLTRLYIEEQPQGCKEVQFVWQGGEPMLADIDFYQHALQLQQKYRRPGMAITNAIQTNGTLIDESWATFLQKHNFLVGLSVDGPAALHDAARIDYSGKGSHDQVLSGYRQLQEKGVTTNILCVVQPFNIAYGADIYRYFVEELEAHSIQFLPVVGKKTVDSKQWGEFLVQVFDNWLENGLGRVSVQLFDATFARITQGIETFCVHAHECGRQLAVERNGDIFSCDHFVDQDHRIGNVLSENYTAMLESDRQQQFTTDSSNLAAICQGCDVKGLCQSGCPRHRDFSGRNKLCAGYYRFFKYSTSYFYAIGECLRRGDKPTDYGKFLPEIKMKIALTDLKTKS